MVRAARLRSSAAIASAHKRGKPALYYYWGPTWVMGLYDSTRLEEPAYDKSIFDALKTEENPTKATAYPQSTITIGVNNDFKAAAPTLINFLTNYETSNALVSEMLAYMQENGEKPEDAALYFLKEKPGVWKAWVPEKVAERVEAAKEHQHLHGRGIERVARTEGPPVAES